MTISKLGALLPAAVLCAFFASGLAGAETPVRLAITDLEGLEQIQREFGGFRDRLSKNTGIPIEFYAVPNRTAAVEAMNAKKVDLVLSGPAEYVVFRKRTGAVPVLGFSRPDYFATIVVLADNGLGRVADLNQEGCARAGRFYLQAPGPGADPQGQRPHAGGRRRDRAYQHRARMGGPQAWRCRGLRHHQRQVPEAPRA
jgi:ABC transporter, phosphonate, periplasmic substrate-binding protein